MTKEQVILMFEEEQIKNLIIGEELYNKENGMGICNDNGCWKVYSTDERICIDSSDYQ